MIIVLVGDAREFITFIDVNNGKVYHYMTLDDEWIIENLHGTNSNVYYTKPYIYSTRNVLIFRGKSLKEVIDFCREYFKWYSLPYPPNVK